jgi:LPS sulfotransferase NodH
MPQYLLTYRNPVGYERTEDSGARWRAWFESMGDALVQLGQPVAEAEQIGTCDPTATDLGGYSVIQADTMASAVAIARGCPHLSRQGGVEVGELATVPTSV